MASFESNGNAEPMLASYTTSESDYAITYNEGQTPAEEEARSDALVSGIPALYVVWCLHVLFELIYGH